MGGERASKRPLRADAVRNQARILDAAKAVFARRGLGVSLDEIAQAAGVGVATLYRRFPDRERLVAALFEREMQNAVAMARGALSAADPWKGLVTLLRAMFATVAQDRGVREAFLSSRTGLGATNASRQELIRLLSAVVRRAQDAGVLRAGITAHDIPAMLLMIGAFADFAGDVRPSAWRRYGELLIDGLAASNGQTALAPGPLTDKELNAASSRW